MTPFDIAAIEKLMTSSAISPKSVVIHSGSPEEIELVKKVWKLTPTVIGQDSWNLDSAPPRSATKADVIVACNTFMCSNDPGLWIDNMSGIANYLLVQDSIVAQRNAGRHLDPPSGDVRRFSISHLGIEGKTDKGYELYDLSRHKIIDVEIYYSSSGPSWVKFAAIVDIRRCSDG